MELGSLIVEYRGVYLVGHRPPGPGIALHSKDSTEWKRIPITSVPATLIARPSLLWLDDLAKAVHEADARHDICPEHIERALERLFLAFLREHGLPPPHTNRARGAHYVDCHWPAHNLTVELDSYRFHRTRRAWETDRQRERDARARGDDFRRYTRRDVAEDPAPMLAELRGLIGVWSMWS